VCGSGGVLGRDGSGDVAGVGASGKQQQEQAGHDERHQHDQEGMVQADALGSGVAGGGAEAAGVCP